MRCHFVPQGYLRRFANSGNVLDCFDLTQRFDPTRPKSVKQTAQIENWYLLEGIDKLPGFNFTGEKRIEENYQKAFETKLPGALDRFEQHKMSGEDKTTISSFIAYELHRVPVSRAYYREMKAAALQTIALSDREKTLRIARIVMGHLSTAISAIALQPYLLASQWVLVRNNSNRPFITSDNPIVLHRPPKNLHGSPIRSLPGATGPERETRDATYGFTVSPNYVLLVNTVVRAREDSLEVAHGKWDRAAVDEYNDLVFRSCLSCVYTVEKSISDEYANRFSSGQISQDLFVDDPWGESDRS